ncbi:unnamed protein product [Gongylonema pulchrum]|uniref:Polyprotein n=1 Tax=Gongylonema pulchrum TaxID=637853 RepID=A0A183DRJ2_9BILA|nr:unnamed protein product [Gongylonema pulchrum]
MTEYVEANAGDWTNNTDRAAEENSGSSTGAAEGGIQLTGVTFLSPSDYNMQYVTDDNADGYEPSFLAASHADNGMEDAGCSDVQPPCKYCSFFK